MQNIDDIVDYRAEYTAVIRDYQIDGEKLIGLCPFHDDEKPSFSVSLKNGKWKCFAENEGGNFTQFYAKLHGIDTKQAYRAICDKYHVGGGEKKKLASYTLEQYAHDKAFPVSFLTEKCGVSTGEDRRSGLQYLRTAYLGEDGEEATYRKRYANKEFRWAKLQDGSSKIIPYGVWRLSEFREAGYVVLVEGESDTQTLWYLGIPALGIPGASMFKREFAEYLKDFRVFVHQEPDKGGSSFVASVTQTLAEADFCDVKVIRCSDLGAKDPSDLYMENGRDDAARMLRELMQSAQETPQEHDAAQPQIEMPGLTEPPILLRMPSGWAVDDSGIYRVKERSDEKVCGTPILITKKLHGIDGGEEKVELAFRSDCSAWQRVVFPRSTVFNKSGIVDLISLGCEFSSENAKDIVKYLMELLICNKNQIPRMDSSSTFGWQTGGRFVPGFSDGIVMHVDTSQRRVAAGYCESGDAARWKEHMQPHRERNVFRFLLSASFAAPLLRIVKQRIFIVYNWCSSKGGKTAALKAILSAWGNPDDLLVSFYATQVALERRAAFFCDLPLCIDERQNPGKNVSLDSIVYMIGNGMGKERGSRNGGLQETKRWRTVAIATGEEPIAAENSMTGVSTRVLEICGSPFENERDAAAMHVDASTDYGFAGAEFIRRLVAVDEADVIAAYKKLYDYVSAISDGKSGSHVSGVSVVALADAMADAWLFGGTDTQEQDEDEAVFQKLGVGVGSLRRAKEMAAEILKDHVEKNAFDVNENAARFISGWIAENERCFTDASPIRYGEISSDGSVVYVVPTSLHNALTKAGYSVKKTLQYLQDRDLLGCCNNCGRKIYRVQKRIGGVKTWCLKLYLDKMTGAASQTECQTDFEQLDDDGGEELPFA